MKIYLTHSKDIHYESKLYKPLRSSSLNTKHQIIFPHENSDQPVNSKELIPTCDIILAEVSLPSTGQGIELGWANAENIPIIAFYQNQPSSRSLRFIAAVLFSYKNGDDLTKKLTKAIKQHEAS